MNAAGRTVKPYFWFYRYICALSHILLNDDRRAFVWTNQRRLAGHALRNCLTETGPLRRAMKAFDWHLQQKVDFPMSG
jgi:hypothetical protein